MDPSVVNYHYPSPAGMLELIANNEHFLAIKFLFSAGNETGKVDHPLIKAGVEQLDDFFEGRRRDFDLPLKMVGTEFQRKVWGVVSEIPLGHTLSYLEVARELGDERAVRSVGAANGKNPYHIVIPCHRVVGANGELIGYAGGLNRKKWLLDFEKKIVSRQLELF